MGIGQYGVGQYGIYIRTVQYYIYYRSMIVINDLAYCKIDYNHYITYKMLLT